MLISRQNLAGVNCQANSDNAWISGPPVPATPPLQQLKAKYWFCLFCYFCQVLDLQLIFMVATVLLLLLCFGFRKGVGNAVCVLFGSLLPAACFAFHSPWVTTSFCPFSASTSKILQARRQRRELFLKGGEKILIIFDRSVLAACPCQNISKKSYCSFFLVYFWWSRLIWKFSKNIFSGRRGLPKQCYCYNMPMLMEVTL